MPGIEIGKAISEHGINIVTGIFLVLVCWLVRYLVKEQSKNMKEILSMSKVELKGLQKAIQKGNATNARLNRKSISMVGALSEYLNRHFNGCADKVNFKGKVKKKNGQK